MSPISEYVNITTLISIEFLRVEIEKTIGQ